MLEKRGVKDVYSASSGSGHHGGLSKMEKKMINSNQRRYHL